MKRLNIDLDDDVHARLKRLCMESSTSMSQYVRKLILTAGTPQVPDLLDSLLRDPAIAVKVGRSESDLKKLQILYDVGAKSKVKNGQ